MIYDKKKFLLFQFHKGTIKTRPQAKGRYLLVRFQFHKGTIKTSSSTLIALILAISIP